MPTVRLNTPAAAAEISTTAAMLTDAEFRVQGRSVRPLARAPWLDEAPDPALDELPGHLRVLGGEFVAVPFGASAAPDAIGPEWDGVLPDQPPVPQHGYAADDEWEVVEVTTDSVVLTLAYPDHEAIERLERRVQLAHDRAAIEFELVLHARRPTRTAIGLHPILALPSDPGTLLIEASFQDGFTYPGTVWPGQGRALPASRFASLTAVPAPEGAVDLSRLPLSDPVEDILLLAGATGPVRIRNEELGVLVEVDWDRAVLPSVMLWMSDRALQETPWRGRYRGLGVEPIAATFDFGEAASAGRNPIAAAGHRTAVDLTPGMPTRIRSSIAVETL